MNDCEVASVLMFQACFVSAVYLFIYSFIYLFYFILNFFTVDKFYFNLQLD